ncbi:phenylalanine 4-monooxygenase [Endozoicomonas euniceicola]|uniref:Phenylalanine-4-hydroxylase n=1 Tax=Endozoicomonas euniceicola TaxID=1234143 RepID=A0ABY6GTH2_9GAMM|nr:phenylalanine 4-monooxygenase [Endozoicomonas euniceicola]UYM16055.1 phenylalanine 4-monooxygenase [Endozoicomonas euniceicola]
MKSSTYTARKADEQGFIHYPDEEHETWSILYNRQIKNLPNRACDEFTSGLELLRLSPDRIPQLPEVSEILAKETGWGVARVPALISFDRFFQLLADQQFPVATFIRTREELDYLQEPDIFHEIFGHCPLLTNPAFASLTQTFGKVGLEASKEERVYLARLYWFTVEFGLLDTPSGKRIYGGGILSSYKETLSCLGSKPVHQSFGVNRALRTPYRIDIVQPIYFVINGLADLKVLGESDLLGLVREAMKQPMYEPLFPPAT